MLSLVFVLTTSCPLSCPHCLRDGGQDQHLPLELVEKAISGASAYGLEGVHLTGGEPFFYPQLSEVFALARRFKAPVSFSTNGLLLEGNEALITQNKDLIRLLNISVDSDSQRGYEAIRGRGNFPALLRNLKFCRRLGIPFAITACLHATNRRDPLALSRFAKKQGALYVNISTALPCRASLDNHCVLSPEERQALVERVRRAERWAQADPLRLFSAPVRITEPLYASSGAVMCPNQSLRGITIDVDGSVHFCCFLTLYGSSSQNASKLRLAQLKEVSFKKGLDVFVQEIQSFVRARLEDQAVVSSPEDLDFRSCFYCYKKLGLLNDL